MKELVCLFIVTLTSPTLASELKILNTPDGTSGPPPCALTCTGVLHYNETGDHRWVDILTGQAGKSGDISECGFVSTPVVVASTHGPYGGQRAIDRCPSVYISTVDKKKFWVFTVGTVKAKQVTGRHCDVNWVANGYSC